MIHGGKSVSEILAHEHAVVSQSTSTRAGGAEVADRAEKIEVAGLEEEFEEVAEGKEGPAAPRIRTLHNHRFNSSEVESTGGVTLRKPNETKVTEVAGIPYWSETQPHTSIKPQTGAKKTSHEDEYKDRFCADRVQPQVFSLWEALFQPEKISKATEEMNRLSPQPLPGPDLMDLTLIPLALLPGRLGQVTRIRIVQAFQLLFQPLRLALATVSKLPKMEVFGLTQAQANMGDQMCRMVGSAPLKALHGAGTRGVKKLASIASDNVWPVIVRNVEWGNSSDVVNPVPNSSEIVLGCGWRSFGRRSIGFHILPSLPSVWG
mmetsp:Transcript_36938/g.57788  ORF Transcript_36938/g.57788 Transcript_36938/m.57788 type:complete len:319 (+) Transcript_36938:78-1034(+)